jgi:hypothetical protein
MIALDELDSFMVNFNTLNIKNTILLLLISNLLYIDMSRKSKSYINVLWLYNNRVTSLNWSTSYVSTKLTITWMIILSPGVLQKGICNATMDQNGCDNVIGFVVTERSWWLNYHHKIMDDFLQHQTQKPLFYS